MSTNENVWHPDTTADVVLERFLYLFNRLDKNDRAEIIGEMKAMLWDDKYRKEKPGTILNFKNTRKQE